MLPQDAPEARPATLGPVNARPITALLLAAGPDAAGSAALLARAEEALAAGTAVRVLLSGAGLAWARDARLETLRTGGDVAVCSRNARAAGWSAEDTPPRIRWSSVATWLAEVQALAPEALWAALP